METLTRIVEALTGLNKLVEVEVEYANPDDLANGDLLVIDFGHSTPLLVEVLKLRRTTSSEVTNTRCGSPKLSHHQNVSFALARFGDPEPGRPWGERIKLNGTIHNGDPDIFRVVNN